MKKKLLLKVAVGVILLASGYGYTQFQKQQPPVFEITTLDVGQGDAHLIEFRDGEVMLVDCGPDKKVLERLGANLPSRDRVIDYLLVTHPHLDHYGGCIDVVKRYQIKHIIYNTAGSREDQYWRTWDDTMKASGAEIRRLTKVERWEIASTTLEFLSPDPELNITSKDVNDTSIVFRLTDAPTQVSVLFTGDAEEPVEKALLNHYCLSPTTSSTISSVSSTMPENSRTKKVEPEYLKPCPALQANILKAGHHGSDTSSIDDFLEAVAPKTALVSCGINNKFHHPSLRTVKRFERMGITILRTDQKGDILVR